MKQKLNAENAPALCGHTPGPWKVIDGIGCGTIYSIQAENPESGNGVLAAVLHAPSKLRPLVVAQSNARLIAAAPELLEALRHCAGVIHAIRTGNVPTDLIPHIDSERIARAAIAKATGGVA